MTYQQIFEQVRTLSDGFESLGRQPSAASVSNLDAYPFTHLIGFHHLGTLVQYEKILGGIGTR